jgi:hypothetical protein
MKIETASQRLRKGLFPALVIAAMLYAVVVLVASTPAHAAGVSGELLCVNPHLVSCQVDETSCYFESGGVGTCCFVCYNYECADGSLSSRCRTECGAQC